jgi:hypothetical protein
MLKKDSIEAKRLERLIGHRLGPYMSHNPVSAVQIWQWCSAMGDKNPSYSPGASQIAPPAMMQMWTMRDINDCYAPGSTDAPPYQVFETMQKMGYSSNVAVSYDISFHRYLREGDRAQHFTSVVGISDKKVTALGEGFFVTERVEYFTLDEKLFAEARITYFQYHAAITRAVATEEPTEVQSERAAAEFLRMKELSSAQVEVKALEIETLRVGDPLPEVSIPVSHKLIVSGAIATQDFVPVHHNMRAAQAAGMPDIFMNILTTSGLSARYLSDWGGPQSRLQKLQFDLKAPNLPGDVMVMKGEIVAINPQPSGALVTAAFTGENRLGIHTSGSATLALPS